MANESKCPFNHAAGGGTTNRDWWPNQLNLKILHQNPPVADPMGEAYDYAAEVSKLDVDALRSQYTLPVGSDQRWMTRLKDGTLLSLRPYG